MTLFLQGTALNEERMSQPLIGRFDERGGTLGRSDNATFTLPDPERRISRIQAKVFHNDGGYWIENVSPASPVFHNGRLLSAGMRVVLHDGDELKVGGYTLLAAFEDDESSATILRGRTVIPPIEPARSAPRGGAPSPLRPQTPPAPPRYAPQSTPAATPAQAWPPGGGDPLWRGFLEGARMELPAGTKPSPELFAAIGAMLRIAIGGIHRLVAMRALAKDQMHTEMTMVQGDRNNPLKFTPDAAVALQLMLQPPARGFLDGPGALREAMIDLQSHQVGMVAGMRAAVDAVLDRFDPAKLEAQLTRRSMFASLLPAHRRARLWESYLEHYRSLREEAQEDYQRFFGEAFREAYEAQVRSLEAAPPSSAGADKWPR